MQRTRPPSSSPYTVKKTLVAVTTMPSGSSYAVPSTVGVPVHPASGQRRSCPPSASVVKYTFDPSSAMPRGWSSPVARTVGLAQPEMAQATTWPSVLTEPVLVQYTRCASTATAWGKFRPEASTVGPAGGQPPIAHFITCPSVPVAPSAAQYTFVASTAMPAGNHSDPEAITVGLLPQPPRAHFITCPVVWFVQYTLVASTTMPSGPPCPSASTPVGNGPPSGALLSMEASAWAPMCASAPASACALAPAGLPEPHAGSAKRHASDSGTARTEYRTTLRASVAAVAAADAAADTHAVAAADADAAAGAPRWRMSCHIEAGRGKSQHSHGSLGEPRGYREVRVRRHEVEVEAERVVCHRVRRWLQTSASAADDFRRGGASR